MLTLIYIYIYIYPDACGNPATVPWQRDVCKETTNKKHQTVETILNFIFIFLNNYFSYFNFKYNFHTSLAPFWHLFGTLLAPFWAVLGSFGTLLAPLGSFWAPLGPKSE